MSAFECFVVAALFDIAFWVQPCAPHVTIYRYLDRWVPVPFFIAGVVKLVQP